MNDREKAMLLAFYLWSRFNAKQVDIAHLLQVSEATISLWLKEMRYVHQKYESNPLFMADVSEVLSRASAMSHNVTAHRRTYGF